MKTINTFEQVRRKRALKTQLNDTQIPWTDENQAELDAIETLENDMGEAYGNIIVAEEDFAEFVKEEELRNRRELREWPCQYIDWKAAADELRQNYKIVKWQGQDYLCESL